MRHGALGEARPLLIEISRAAVDPLGSFCVRPDTTLAAQFPQLWRSAAKPYCHVAATCVPIH